MAINYLNATNSSKQANVNTTFSFDHTVDGNADYLIILVSGWDSSVTDVVCTSVSSSVDGAATERIGYEKALSADYGHVSAWRIDNPTSGLHTITVGFAGKTTNADATAVDLQNAASINSSNSFDQSGSSLTATLAGGDGFILGICLYDNIDPADISVAQGTQIVSDDLGSVIAVAAYRTSTQTLQWSDVDSNIALAVAVSFNAVAGVPNEVMMIISNMG